MIDNSYFARVNTACDDVRDPLRAINKEAPKNGGVYIYLSNESNEPVYFDNFVVSHERGRIVEENHYYSYGLKIEGISSRAQSTILNKYGYQGDFSEHDEATALDEFDLRHYDPQIGRWTTTDPYEQFANPYLGMGNSPVNNVDPDGGCIWCETLEKALRLSEVTVTIGKSAEAGINPLTNLLSSSSGLIYPIINISMSTALNTVGNGITQFSKGLWNEGVMPTVDWVTHNVNPVYGVFNGINSQFTHQDFFDGTPMTRAEGITDAALPFIPFGKVGGVVEKSLFRGFEKTVAKGALNPNEIHFMQSSIKNATGEFTVLGNAQSLKSGALNPELLIINVWKDASGKIWTLGHRRLASFRLSGLQEAPIQ